ncbi:MAG: hypothetical protein U0Q12_15570 [Vicinamibacterales bacterium]
MKVLVAVAVGLGLLVTQDLPHAFPREGATSIVDNARVSMWDVTWFKGKPSPMHRHRYDLVGVYLVGSAIKVTGLDGNASESRVDPGFVLFQPKGVTHIEEGMDEKNPRHAILVDLKETTVAPIANTSGHPTAFPREGAKKVLENDRVVIWDYRWTLGKPTPMHFHDKDVFVVYMDEGELKSTTPDGRSEITKVTVGLARYNPRNRVHSEELVKGAARAIITELK